MSIWQKALVIISILLSFIFLGSMAMVLVLKSINIFPEDIQNIGTLSLSTLELRVLKVAFGLNHFISFIVSGSLLIWIFSQRKPINYTGIIKSFDVGLFFKLLLLLFLTYPIYGLIISLINQLNLPDWASSMDETNLGALKQILQMDTPLDFILNFLVIAIFAGVGEEMIFRGVIQKELYNYLNPITSIIVAALLFSALHFEFTGFIPKFLIGTVLGYAYYLTKNLLFPILLHTFNNGLQLVILYLSGTILEQENPEVDLTSMLGALLFIPLIILLIRHLNKYKANGSNA